MKFWSKLISCAVALFMVSITCLPALAAQSNITVSLPANQVWSVGYGDRHISGHGYIGARCHTVFPESGFDTYTRIQYSAETLERVRVTKKEFERLTEGASNYTLMELLPEYVGRNMNIYFMFRGNSNASARAIVSYSASGN